MHFVASFLYSMHTERIQIYLWSKTRLIFVSERGVTSIAKQNEVRRNDMFSKELTKQRNNIGRIEKIEVQYRGQPEDISLVMNKHVSTPFDCARRKLLHYLPMLRLRYPQSWLQTFRRCWWRGLLWLASMVNCGTCTVLLRKTANSSCCTWRRRSRTMPTRRSGGVVQWCSGPWLRTPSRMRQGLPCTASHHLTVDTQWRIWGACT